jgi:hypothetical protein
MFSRASSEATTDIRRRLVIVEAGAASLLQELDPDFDDTIAVAQLPDEAPAAFANRVLHRLGSAERSREIFQQALLCVSAANDAQARAARRLIALGVAAQTACRPALSELLVCGPSSASLEQRQSLLELADELVLAAERTPLPVRLKFLELAPPTPLKRSA